VKGLSKGLHGFHIH